MSKRVLLTLLLMAAASISAQLAAASQRTAEKSSDQWCTLIPEPSKPLPTLVVHAVMNSKDAVFARKAIREHGNDPYRDAPLEGVRVRLADSGGPTYLVGGLGPMTGGDNRWFWLVQQSGEKAVVLLYVSTGCIHIDNNRTDGYRNIETEWQAAGYRVIREYHWNGNLYKPVGEHREEAR